MDNIFDGRQNGYLPPTELSISSTLRLHSDSVAEIDPVDREVMRSKLWNLNLEHGETLERASGSPLIVHAHDFQTSVHTEDGESVMFGPGLQYFAGTTDAMIKWTLENRSASPGIRDHDIFIQNDPYIGCNHQMDTSLYAPVFVQGALFCWVNSTCHWADVGGAQPGSFVPFAKDIFWEGAPIPPIKIVEAGDLRRDLEEMIKRKSRQPQRCGMELRAQIAGLNVAKQRMLEMVQQYTPSLVKGVMRSMLDATERAIVERLRSLPDGTWRDVMYLGCVAPGDRTLRKQVLTMTKAGGHLQFSNAGTSEQSGSANCSATTWRAALLSALMSTLAWDQKFCAGGVLRCMTLNPVPGTANACSFPAAVSSSSAAVTSIYQALVVVSKMLLCGKEVAHGAMVGSGLHTMAFSQLAAIKKSGEITGTSITDPSALGAFSFRDGVSFGGFSFNPRSRMAVSVEVWEEALDILILYRRANRGGGGHGQWRGGTSTTYALMKHNATQLTAANTALAPSIPGAHGVFGGYPGSGGGFYFSAESRVLEILKSGRVLGTPAELREAGPGRAVKAKESNVSFGPSSIWEVRHATAPGFGDPLKRSPEKVQEDVQNAELSINLARDIYGVVFSADGNLDRAKTERARLQIAADRLSSATAAHLGAEDRGLQYEGEWRVRYEIGDTFLVVESGRNRFLACAGCREPLCALNQNYKEYCPKVEFPLADADASQFSSSEEEVDGQVVLRQYLCSKCGALLQSDLCKPEDQPVWDIQLT
jgi:N-methylhydantoinase B